MGKEQLNVLAAPFGRKKQPVLPTLRGELATLALPLLMSYLLVQGLDEDWRYPLYFPAVTAAVLLLQVPHTPLPTAAPKLSPSDSLTQSYGGISQAGVSASAVLVGAVMTISQGMSLLSYGLLPTTLGCALCFNVKSIHLRAMLVAPCFVWSSYGASPNSQFEYAAQA